MSQLEKTSLDESQPENISLPEKTLDNELGKETTSLNVESIKSDSDHGTFSGEYHPDDVDLLAPELTIDDSPTLLENFKLKVYKKPKNYYDQIATRKSVFEGPDPNIVKTYFPTSKWENFKAFDPYFRWTYAEDKAVTRKIDYKILPIVCALFFCLNLDRGNLSSAVAGGILVDLKMTTDDYNLGNNLRSIGFIITEIPSQMLAKKFGPDWWMPLQVIIWSIIALAQYWVNDKKAFWALRFLLGVSQGGFIADSVSYVSYFYTRQQTGPRLAAFWSLISLSGIISNLLAVGFLKVTVQGKASWRWLFMFDGIITLVFGIAALFLMVPGPTQTKSKLFPKGFFNEKEEKIITNRLIRDDPTKCDMHNREGITFKQFLKTLLDYDLWPLLVLSLTYQIAYYPMSAYLNINLKALGFGTDQILYLNLPIYVFEAFTIVAITLISEFFNERALIIEFTSAEKISNWGQYAVMFFLISMPNIQPILTSWISRISYSVRARTISSPMSNIGIQLAQLISNNVYRSDDSPYYHRGNKALVGVTVMNIVLFALTKVYYIYRNKYKKGKWDSMSDSEKETYLQTHRNDGNKRLDFLFEH
ncbi:hypothetical protein PSN45_003621 [Yamadazyma tenuis]|uniref:uncharacterized protein n=1 Tax=Candida tenuis TaxID=2315449 RepID=UPI00279C2B81|nr:hypothetical protein PSN45_003621 [Yamadazyma tenuis]